MFKGKKALVLGVANKRSIAWAIAKRLADGGARLVFTYQGERIESGVRELAGTVDAPQCGTLSAGALETSCAAVRAAMEGRLPETVVRIRVSGGRRATRAATG